MGWVWGCLVEFCEFDFVMDGCRLCGVGSHMCVVKLQDVGCEVLNWLLVS